jgi:hypothetical protein
MWNHLTLGGKNVPIEPTCPRLAYSHSCYLHEFRHTGIQPGDCDPARRQLGASFADEHATGSFGHNTRPTAGRKEGSP